MKKVMVYAYTKLNLGDDLFIKVLCERYPNIEFVLYAPRIYKHLFNEVNNLTIYPNDSLLVKGVNYLFRIFKIRNISHKLIAQSTDAAVYIGGSLFMQGENWREGLKNVKNMRIKNKPFFLLGANFGPYKNEQFYIEYKELFKNYTDICFREIYSYELFNGLNNVRMADDIIFQLKDKKNEQDGINIVISVIKPSVRNHLRDYDEIYYEKIKDISMYFIDKGYKVTIMSFCEYEGDAEAGEEIMTLIPNDYLNNVSMFLYKTNIEEALSIISKSSFVVATRFHSMILGWVHNKPVFPIVYSEKMTNVMKDVGFNGGYTAIDRINSLKPEEVYVCMEENLIDISNQRRNAEKHFEKLDEFLER